MNETEMLMTAAMAKQAERTLPAGPVLPALNRPPRRRARPLLVAAGAAAAVAAVAITIPIVLRPEATAPPAGQVQPAAGIPIKVRAGYLPEGFREIRRASELDGGVQLRQWENAEKKSISVGSYSTQSAEWENRAGCRGNEQATVNGKPAQGRADGETYEVSWMAEQDLCVLVSTSLGQETALRIAESIRPDGESTVQPLVAFGALPEGLTPALAQIIVEPTGVAGYLSARSVDRNAPAVEVHYVPKGHPNRSDIVVDVPGDHELRFRFSGQPALTDQEKQQITGGVKVTQNPDLSWVGR